MPSYITIRPLEVYRDDRVRVTAVPVDHHQVYPAFAFRFDTVDATPFPSTIPSNGPGPQEKLRAPVQSP
ncbi:MAG: hypothetical protein ABFC89_07760 [Methanospirillum sp.]